MQLALVETLYAKLVLVGTLLAGCAERGDAEVLTKIVFTEDYAAEKASYCLDGTPAGYFVKERPESAGWVIYLQGGGLCVTPFDCKNRAKNGGKEGSSAKWDPTFTDTTNVLSDDPANPFANYSKVWVPYCSGDTWTGTTLKNKYLDSLHTTGHNNVQAVLDHLHSTTSFSKADNLLLSGGSAGGIGVFHNADFVGDYTREVLGLHNITYKASPQAGWFFPGGIYNYVAYALGLRIPFDMFGTDTIHYIELGYVNEACVAALGKKEIKQCWDVNVVQRYLATPLFVAQNQVDQNQVVAELLCPGGLCSSMTTLSSTPGQFMKDYSNKSVESLAVFKTIHPGGGVFQPSCFDHTGNLCMTRGPNIGGVSYGQALGAWYFERRGVPTTLVDACTPDQLFCGTNCESGGCGDALNAW